MRALPALAAIAAALAALTACSAPTPDDQFESRLQGHYLQMVDPDAWPQVISAAHASCDRLTGVNPPPWAANLLVIETQGDVDEDFADHVARAGADVYCPEASQLAPATTG